MANGKLKSVVEQGRKRVALQGMRYFLHVGFWAVALLLGIVSGLAAVIFQLGINWLQESLYGAQDATRLHSFIETLPWYWLVAIPTIGGLCVGVIFHVMTDDGRVRSVADVIEASALNDGRVEIKAGLASALASFITLSTGGSAGREGPVVHIAAMISTKICHWLDARGVTARDLLGCAVAAAVSASFNAPIAGALFALEVILRHFALHAFAPIVISSVAGAVVHQLILGDMREFNIPQAPVLEFYAELPAFMILGLVCGVVAVVLMRAIFFADDVANDVQNRLSLPRWLRPAIAGLLLGLIATQFPVIIGVGYETTFAALKGNLDISAAIIFAVVKVVAVAITMGGRMGGGIFSPALMVGALTGLAFGGIAVSFVPDLSGGYSVYALAGMASVAAAVLSAPISTTLIVFEMTGDWQTGLAVLVAVSLASALSARFVARSFFLTQLERRQVELAAGPQNYILSLVPNNAVMKPVDTPTQEHWDLVQQGGFVSEYGTLKGAMPIFHRTRSAVLPVVRFSDQGAPAEIVGLLYEVEALRAYAQALVANAEEEHS